MEVANSSQKWTMSRRPGVALLMSLSIIMLLSIALMSAFESRTVEVVHLENSLERFQAETLSRSVFRAVLLVIKERGLVFIVKNKQVWQGIPVPIQNGTFQIQAVEPIDHLFDLNTKFRMDDDRTAIFWKLIKNHRVDDTNPNEVYIQDIYPAISAINDWTDTNQERDQAYVYDYEQYPYADPEFEVKNRPFDRLSEVRLLEPFAKFNISEQYLKSNFRVFKGDEYLDVNLADENTVLDYLERFEEVEGFEKIYDSRLEIAGMIARSGDEGGQESSLQITPKYYPPYQKKVGNSDWEDEIEDIVSSFDSWEKEAFMRLFNIRTDHLRIRYRTTVGRVNLDAEVIVKVGYLDLKKSLEIKEFTILSFAFL